MPRSAPIEGSATFTTVTSRMTMNWARHRRMRGSTDSFLDSDVQVLEGTFTRVSRNEQPVVTHDARRQRHRRLERPLAEAGPEAPEGRQRRQRRAVARDVHE